MVIRVDYDCLITNLYAIYENDGLNCDMLNWEKIIRFFLSKKLKENWAGGVRKQKD
jgi:hypothetical protein